MLKLNRQHWALDASAILLGVLLTFLSILSLRLDVDNRLEFWMSTDAEAQAHYRAFLRDYGNDAFLLAGYSGNDLFSEESLDRQLEVLDRLSSIPGVVAVTGIPAVYKNLFGEEDPDALREEVTQAPIYRNFLISADGSVAALLLEIAPGLSQAAQGRLIASVGAALHGLEDAGLEVYLAGPPVLNHALNSASRQEAARTFPLAVAASLLLLLALTRRWFAVPVAALCAGLTVGATAGLMVLFGHPMNMVTAALPALLWVLSLANLIHLLHAFQQARRTGLDTRPAAMQALRTTAWPCAVAATTTGAGFLSLMGAAMQPVRELGLLAALGMVLVMATTLILAPWLLSLLPERWLCAESGGAASKNSVTGAQPGRWTIWVCQKRWHIILGWSVLAVACLGMLPLLRVSSDPLRFLPPDSGTVRDYVRIGESLTGYYALELVVDLGRSWTAPATWPALDTAAAALGEMPGVARVLSPLDLLRQLQHWEEDLNSSEYRLPASQEEAERLLEAAGVLGEDWERRFVASSGRQVRLAAMINVMESTDFLPIVARADQLLAELPVPMHGYSTGMVLQLVQTQMALVQSQLASLGGAMLVIFGCLAIGLRSLRLALVAMLPNVLPLAAIVPIMALFQLPLDPATIMVASIALGIAVDDTVHLLARFIRLRRSGLVRTAAVAGALAEIRGPMITSTAMACTGFLVLLLSNFNPIAWFGLLAAVAMLTALAAEFLLTPALLIACKLERL